MGEWGKEEPIAALGSYFVGIWGCRRRQSTVCPSGGRGATQGHPAAASIGDRIIKLNILPTREVTF